MKEETWQKVTGDDSPWIADYKLADHIWHLVKDARYMNFGPDPPILLEANISFFPDRSLTSNLNTWLFSRLPEEEYLEPDVWEMLSSRHRVEKNEVTAYHAYSGELDSPIERSKVQSQDYTEHGAMFSYEVTQDRGEEAELFMRVPTTRDLYDSTIDRIESVASGVEHVHDQTRMYSDEFGIPPQTNRGYRHPHFTYSTIDDRQTMMDVFTEAVATMGDFVESVNRGEFR